MKYRKGYEYQLVEDEVFQTSISCGQEIITQFITLNDNGLLTIKSGYAWDGPSGPTKVIVEILSKVPFMGAWLVEKFLRSFLTPSLGHDAKYQLIRQGFLLLTDRAIADIELKEDCLNSGMSKVRAGWVYNGVKNFAAFAADPKNAKKVYEVKYLLKRKLDI